jgi:two-component system, chemotaxis family, sensor kinase CheA
MDPMAAIRITFFQECEEQLAELEAGLLALDNGEGDAETVNAVFRAVHSVKGGAGAFGLDDLVRFAHVFESTLDDVRAGKLAASSTVLQVLLRSADVLADLVRAARDGGEVDPARSGALVVELERLIGGAGADAAPAAADEGDDFGFQPLAAGFEFEPLAADAPAGPKGFTVVFKPHAGLYAHANEAALLLRELGRLGEMTVELDASGLPALDTLEAEGAYLSWTATLLTEASEADVREVFDWVDGDCDLEVTSLAPAESADEPAPAEAFDISALLASIQADVAAAPAAEAPPALAPVIAPPSAAPALLAANDAPEAAAPARESRAAAGDDKGAAGQTIRVDLDRVDRLIDLVGELVINGAMLAQRVSQAQPASAAHGHQGDDVASALEGLEHLIHDIQDSVMAIRAQPVRAVFQRMPRLVREVAAMTGKSVRLVTEGEGCEVDKTVIERLSDPLVHMIRNAIDHGLETPEERVAAGKPAEGVVKLCAAHRSGRIVIEVSDDGKGINRKRVRQIAETKGIVQPGVAMTDEEIDNLIFAPGFSTAATVSDISGRGVGMDVVRRQVQALGGRITIASRPGQGSTFTLSLPLTLAVLDGMVVEAAGQTLVVPLTAIVETLQPKPEQVRRLGPSAMLLAVRNEHAPLTDVGQALGFRREAMEPCRGIAMLVEDDTGARTALLVDAIHGQRQVVIKSLEANYGRVDGVAAATILGDGRVALIVDVEALNALRRDASNLQPKVA